MIPVQTWGSSTTGMITAANKRKMILHSNVLAQTRLSTIPGRVASCSRLPLEGTLDGRIPKKGMRCWWAETHSKTAQTAGITSHSKCQRIYNKQQIVSDSFHLRHSSEIVTMSRFPQSPCVNESVLFIMNRPHQASKSLRRHPRPNPTRVDIGNSIDSTSTAS